MNTIPIPSRAALARFVLASLLSAGLTACQSAPKPATAQTFRVMTYNIHHGEGVDGKLDFQRIAELIKRERADIVALQEVDKGVERTARRDCPAELAVLTGMTCVFSNNFHFQGGEYGNAILTRFPVKRWTNQHYKMLRQGEQRGLLQVVLEVHGRELVFMNTHIDFRPDDTERLMNVAELLEIIPAYGKKPMILCGDFNDTPGSRTHERIAQAFVDTWPQAGTGDGPTIPAVQPRKRIDYIWLRKGGVVEPVRAWVPESQASDHLPVVAEFRFR
ncbi:MAG TPA: endonuclease/exonuclease/phosphatase family protein [Candidatus Paceibacterota bacterium]|nr:endonuclease/exonuclease/phosphatase family protein [Verrucomicrobiota bacterium]HSA09757.1 endonuclease/exonuclease/phosphatase family protein [Candidatus Paceibacterota bacterium]